MDLNKNLTCNTLLGNKLSVKVYVLHAHNSIGVCVCVCVSLDRSVVGLNLVAECIVKHTFTAVAKFHN